MQGETSSPVTFRLQALRSDAPTYREHPDPAALLSGVCCFWKQSRAHTPLQKNPRPRFWKPFVAGVCAALLAVSVVIPGWQFLDTPSTSRAATQGAADTTTGCAFSRPDGTTQQNTLTVKSCVRGINLSGQQIERDWQNYRRRTTCNAVRNYCSN